MLISLKEHTYCLFYLSFKQTGSKIFQFPEVFDDWLWPVKNAAKEVVVRTGLKTAVFWVFGCQSSFCTCYIVPWTVHKLPMCCCLVSVYMEGTSHAWLSSYQHWHPFRFLPCAHADAVILSLCFLPLWHLSPLEAYGLFGSRLKSNPHSSALNMPYRWYSHRSDGSAPVIQASASLLH